MPKEKIDRKIAVIFATDIVGYSKHMEANESETIHNLRDCEKILKDLFDQNGGRLFNTGGDSFLAEFPSAVSAVECAVEFQNVIKERNSYNNTSVKLQFRIGIHSGDVVKEKGNLLGDGVNVAARLEALAQTNGITVSKVIYDYVKGKTKHEFNDLGTQKVKQNEFHAFDLLLNQSQKRMIKRRSKSVPVLAAFILVLAGLITFFFLSLRPEIAEINSNSDRTSLLVIPFEDKSGNEDGKIIADGISGQVSTTLKKYNELYVFDESSAEYFQRKEFSNSKLLERFGVQFALKGSIQTLGSKIRVNLSLQDLEKRATIWSETLDFKDDDIFEVQDKISDAVLANIIPGIMSLEVANNRIKQQFTPQVHLNRLKARVAYEKHSPEGLYEYEQILKLNRELEPNNPYLDMDEAWLLMGEIWFGVSDDTATNVNNAYKLTLKTLDADPNSPYALDLASMIERGYLNELDKACGRLEKMVRTSQDPSNMANTANLARNCGEYDQSLSIFRNILEKAPHFRLWFKKAYAWTFLMNEFEKNRNDFSEAKSYIQFQLENNYSEDGLNEMWVIMLAYIAKKEGNSELAQDYVSRQSKMTDPINVSWAKRYPDILDENPKFKGDLFNELAEMGISF
ncbi:MAG: hypothetical protein OSB15_10985 [Amylibacter sp.]|nr:hypothetical protein [Amylibacter sp.]